MHKNVFQIDSSSELSDPTPRTPEQQLIASVIGRAVRDIFLVDPKSKKEAEYWIFHCSQAVEWSFIWCCGTLGYDHRVLRNRIKYVKEVSPICPFRECLD